MKNDDENRLELRLSSQDLPSSSSPPLTNRIYYTTAMNRGQKSNRKEPPSFWLYKRRVSSFSKGERKRVPPRRLENVYEESSRRTNGQQSKSVGKLCQRPFQVRRSSVQTNVLLVVIKSLYSSILRDGLWSE